MHEPACVRLCSGPWASGKRSLRSLQQKLPGANCVSRQSWHPTGGEEGLSSPRVRTERRRCSYQGAGPCGKIVLWASHLGGFSASDSVNVALNNTCPCLLPGPQCPHFRPEVGVGGTWPRQVSDFSAGAWTSLPVPYEIPTPTPDISRLPVSPTSSPGWKWGLLVTSICLGVCFTSSHLKKSSPLSPVTPRAR